MYNNELFVKCGDGMNTIIGKGIQISIKFDGMKRSRDMMT